MSQNLRFRQNAQKLSHLRNQHKCGYLLKLKQQQGETNVARSSKSVETSVRYQLIATLLDPTQPEL